MKWVTRANVHVDRVACPWLIKKFVDPNAEFIFVPREEIPQVVESEGAIPFDTTGVELGHHGKKCSFEAIIEKYNLTDPALLDMAQIVNGADTDNSLYNRREAWGLEVIADGFRYLGLKDDHTILEKEFIVYDALYAHCQHTAQKI